VAPKARGRSAESGLYCCTVIESHDTHGHPIAEIQTLAAEDHLAAPRRKTLRGRLQTGGKPADDRRAGQPGPRGRIPGVVEMAMPGQQVVQLGVLKHGIYDPRHRWGVHRARSQSQAVDVTRVPSRGEEKGRPGRRVMYPSITILRSPIRKYQLAIDIQVISTLGHCPPVHPRPVLDRYRRQGTRTRKAQMERKYFSSFSLIIASDRGKSAGILMRSARRRRKQPRLWGTCAMHV